MAISNTQVPYPYSYGTHGRYHRKAAAATESIRGIFSHNCQAAAAGHMCKCIVARRILSLQLCLKFASLVRSVGPRIISFRTYVVLESSRVVTVLLFMGDQRVCIPYLPARARPHMTSMSYPDSIDHFWRVLHCLWNVLVS